MKMKPGFRYFLCALLCGMIVIPPGPGAGAAERMEKVDPWARLQQLTAAAPGTARKPATAAGHRGMRADEDPWVRLRRVVIPFALKLEREEKRNDGGKLARVVDDKLAPWQDEISRAAACFAIPEAIIKAVIMVESGGDPRARAGSTSASGLMQTIASTFAAARRDLALRGMIIADDPFDPEASIMAGSWYLDQMFSRARADGKPGVEKRQTIKAWRYPLEYYYAGPGHGRKARSRVLIYRDGKRVVIDKQAYSGKVLTWAGKLMRQQNSRPAAGQRGGVS